MIRESMMYPIPVHPDGEEEGELRNLLHPPDKHVGVVVFRIRVIYSYPSRSPSARGRWGRTPAGLGEAGPRG
jgi:hypothetical protein